MEPIFSIGCLWAVNCVRSCTAIHDHQWRGEKRRSIDSLTDLIHFPQWSEDILIMINRLTIFGFASVFLFACSQQQSATDTPTVSSPPLSQMLYPFCEARYRCGYLDADGNVAIPAQFESASGFESNGLARVYQPSGYGVINLSGEMVIPAEYDRFGPFADNGLATVRQNERSGFINENGEIMISAIYQDAETFRSNGLAAVKQNGLWGFINESGEVVIPALYEEIFYNDESSLIGVRENGRWGFINEAGETIISHRYEQVWPFSNNGLAPVQQNGRVGFVNEVGEMVIPARYDWAGRFSNNGLAIVEQNDLRGFINESGELVIPLRYGRANRFADNGLAAVEQGGRWGFINESGEMVIAAQYESVGYRFADNGLVRVEQDDRHGFINEIGVMVIPARFAFPSNRDTFISLPFGAQEYPALPDGTLLGITLADVEAQSRQYRQQNSLPPSSNPQQRQCSAYTSFIFQGFGLEIAEDLTVRGPSSVATYSSTGTNAEATATSGTCVGGRYTYSVTSRYRNESRMRSGSFTVPNTASQCNIDVRYGNVNCW